MSYQIIVLNRQCGPIPTDLQRARFLIGGWNCHLKFCVECPAYVQNIWFTTIGISRHGQGHKHFMLSKPGLVPREGIPIENHHEYVGRHDTYPDSEPSDNKLLSQARCLGVLHGQADNIVNPSQNKLDEELVKSVKSNWMKKPKKLNFRKSDRSRIKLIIKFKSHGEQEIKSSTRINGFPKTPYYPTKNTSNDQLSNYRPPPPTGPHTH